VQEEGHLLRGIEYLKTKAQASGKIQSCIDYIYSMRGRSLESVAELVSGGILIREGKT
jgi:hypothetical protein